MINFLPFRVSEDPDNGDRIASTPPDHVTQSFPINFRLPNITFLQDEILNPMFAINATHRCDGDHELQMRRRWRSAMRRASRSTGLESFLFVPARFHSSRGAPTTYPALIETFEFMPASRASHRFRGFVPTCGPADVRIIKRGRCMGTSGSKMRNRWGLFLRWTEP